MPKTRLKTYPFPYLAEFSKDYKKSEFTLDVGYKSDKGRIFLQPEYHLNNPQLAELVLAKKLKVVVKVRCRTLGLSITEEFINRHNSMTLSFDSMELDNDIDIIAYLVASDSFSFENSDFSDMWKDEKTIILKNNVIGETNERTVTINHVKSGASKSIFKFTRVLSMDDGDPFRVNLDDNECIVFQLSNRMFVQFNSTKDKAREYVYAAFVIPALADILRQMSMKDSNGENEFNMLHGNKKWFQVLCDNYEKAFSGADPTSGDRAPLEAAQTIIDKYALVNLLADGVKKTKGIK